MSALLIAILALIAFGLALQPLFREERRGYVRVTTLDPELENLLSAREATYSAIKDLEMDHAQGKLSDADYANLRTKYETKALSILQQLDARKPKSAAAPVSAGEGTCLTCGEPRRAGAHFCARCGTKLEAGCASCGATLKAGARFCARCGAPIAALQPA